MEEDDEIEEAIATLIATLGDENAQVRAMAAQSLGALVLQTVEVPGKRLWPQSK